MKITVGEGNVEILPSKKIICIFLEALHFHTFIKYIKIFLYIFCEFSKFTIYINLFQ